VPVKVAAVGRSKESVTVYTVVPVKVGVPALYEASPVLTVTLEVDIEEVVEYPI